MDVNPVNIPVEEAVRLARPSIEYYPDVYDDKKRRAAYRNAVKPVWEAFAEHLKAHRYEMLLRMRVRLKNHLREQEKGHEMIKQSLNGWKLLRDILYTEAINHGAQKTLWESLGVLSVNIPGNGSWTWVRSPFAYAIKDANTDQALEFTVSNTHYDLHADPMLLQNPQAKELPQSTFSADATWIQLFERPKRMVEHFEEAKFRNAKVIQQIILRLTTLEAVLWDYEILGEVGELGNPPDRSDIREEATRIVREMISRYEKNPTGYSSITSLMDAVADDFGYGSSKSIRDILKLAEFYKPRNKRGSTGRAAKQILEEQIAEWTRLLPSFGDHEL
jgi:hypothetical protein